MQENLVIDVLKVYFASEIKNNIKFNQNCIEVELEDGHNVMITTK